MWKKNARIVFGFRVLLTNFFPTPRSKAEARDAKISGLVVMRVDIE
jgi:hypothetical protein